MRALAFLLVLVGACASSEARVDVAGTATTTPTTPPNTNVLFHRGAFHQEAPMLTKHEQQALEANGGALEDVCQGPRDVVETCAGQAAGCVPLPIPHAWEPCYGSGALCTEIFRDGERARMLASPPQCFCSCGPEHEAARVRHEEIMRSPPP